MVEHQTTLLRGSEYLPGKCKIWSCWVVNFRQVRFSGYYQPPGRVLSTRKISRNREPNIRTSHPTWVIFVSLFFIHSFFHFIMFDFSCTLYRNALLSNSLSCGNRQEDKIPQSVGAGVHDEGEELLQHRVLGQVLDHDHLRPHLLHHRLLPHPLQVRTSYKALPKISQSQRRPLLRPSPGWKCKGLLNDCEIFA